MYSLLKDELESGKSGEPQVKKKVLTFERSSEETRRQRNLDVALRTTTRHKDQFHSYPARQQMN